MIKYDFHIHSALSPCGDEDMTPNNIVNMAYIAGLNAIAITDHNTIGNVKSAMAIGSQLGITVLAGMEIETCEEIHILTLYPSLESAEKAYNVVYNSLPDIKNRPDIFGRQLYLDENDEIIGEEEKLLISPTSLSVEQVFELVKSVGGVAIPAHVDRHSYSILTNLGFISEELDAKRIEISYTVDSIEEYKKSRPDLEKYKVLRNSDAHYLQDIGKNENYLDVTIEQLFGEV
ncbi:MAG: PHP domain-containing protein [Clostridia bacterium]|nr:PHP domain-containing protein [Clostridia bacterium]